jgi:hypothetical protein
MEDSKEIDHSEEDWVFSLMYPEILKINMNIRLSIWFSHD